jgi:hypothetical protein
LTEIGIGLRAVIGNKVTAFGGFQRGGFDFVAVFVRQSAETAKNSSSVMWLLQPGALTGIAEAPLQAKTERAEDPYKKTFRPPLNPHNILKNPDALGLLFPLTAPAAGF